MTADADPLPIVVSLTPDPPAEPPTAEPAPSGPKAGRDLRSAIVIGLLLAGAVSASLFIVKWLFVAFTIVIMMAAVRELSRALHGRAISVPQIPLAVGAAAVLVATYEGGTEKLVVASLLLVVAAVAWGAVTDGLDTLGGMAASVFVACYVALLGGFAVLMVVPGDGPRRVAAFIATVVCSDTGGYAVGVFLGKHPMAPSVSPKKSWEGFGGSALSCALCGGLLFPLTLHATWWQGVVFGLAVVVASTVGDLSESLIKRDLGIKDMGNLLPGHGGVMDRFDSLLLAAPVAWALLTIFVPWPT
ncbi:MAG TPA: phosphatidate cytidylyltransferase [Acidothermaceae bacterium]|jgi:phosphatidate cytidylyltransferase|nr:phosphatidate cytidylyltransferase [Acidothermaceae bacterium]